MNNQSNNPIYNAPAGWGWVPLEQQPAPSVHPSDPHYPWVLLGQGESLLATGHCNAAVHLFQAVLALKPNQRAEANGVNVRAGFGLGRALLALGHLAPAVDALEKVLEIEPGHIKALQGLCVAYTHTEFSQDAISKIMQRLERLLLEQPDTDALLALPGRMCQTLSIFDFEQRPEWNDGNSLLSDTLLKAANRAVEQEDFEAALRVHEFALRVGELAQRPGSSFVSTEHQLGRANMLLRMERMVEAADALEKVLEIEPGHLEAINGLYEAYKHIDADKAGEKIENRIRRLLHQTPNTDALLALAGRMCQTRSIFDGGPRVLPDFARVCRSGRIQGFSKRAATV